MVEIWVPYGDTEVCLTVSLENLLGIVNPKPRPKTPETLEEIDRALENPLGASKLREIVKPNHKVAIAIDKSLGKLVNIILPKIFTELKQGGIENSNISVFIGNKKGELLPFEKLEEILPKIPSGTRIKFHDPYQTEELVEVGSTGSKTKVFLNKDFFQADIKILMGKLGLHGYAGFSGGPQTILTVSGIKTIHQNYNLSINPKARVGILEENPVHKDLKEITKLCNIDFVMDVFVENGELVKAFSGNLEETFAEGVNYVKSVYEVEVESKADIVVASPGGDPFDSTLYDAQETIEHALKIVRDDGAVVLAAQCSEGYGDQKFYRLMAEVDSIDQLKSIMKKEYIPVSHKIFQLMDTLQRFRVILVSALPNTIATGVFRFKTAKCMEEAIETALRFMGKKSKILVLPYAMKTLPVLRPKNNST
ncbi:nickel-dependent lactate racemase [Candidatus Bathyarchaeota archaeon]|nr:MAG: nickel-dependent lactate racemase [Candidatus Bathyarchaeota archaeon]